MPMNSYAVFCSMFCPRVSCAFATLASSPTATVAACSICAVRTCGSVPRSRLPPASPTSVNTVVAGPCELWRRSLLLNFPPGFPMRLKRRTLHDPPLPCQGIHTGASSPPNLDLRRSVCHPCFPGSPGSPKLSAYSDPHRTSPSSFPLSDLLLLLPEQPIQLDFLCTPFPDIIQNT